MWQGEKNVQNPARFLTTFDFDREYLRNGSTNRKSNIIKTCMICRLVTSTPQSDNPNSRSCLRPYIKFTSHVILLLDRTRCTLCYVTFSVMLHKEVCNISDNNIKRNKQLPAHSVLIVIYSASRGFRCNSTAFLFEVLVGLFAVVMRKLYWIYCMYIGSVGLLCGPLSGVYFFFGGGGSGV